MEEFERSLRCLCIWKECLLPYSETYPVVPLWILWSPISSSIRRTICQNNFIFGFIITRLQLLPRVVSNLLTNLLSLINLASASNVLMLSRSNVTFWFNQGVIYSLFVATSSRFSQHALIAEAGTAGM